MRINSPESSIAVATTTYYRNWYPGNLTVNHLADKVRGDLALNAITKLTEAGFTLAVVDGGSSGHFLTSLTQTGAVPIPETERGMSGSRRQAFKAASLLPGVKAVAWMEAEKVSYTTQISKAAQSILSGEADIVIPSRDRNAFDTYPDFQAEYEQKANQIFNRLLSVRGLISPDENFDTWFGPRIFKNTPELLELFSRRYVFAKNGKPAQEVIDPEKWPNALFLPLVNGFNEGFRIVTEEVEYNHPAEQTRAESDDDLMRIKRHEQFVSILTATVNLMRLWDSNPFIKARSQIYLDK